MALAIETNLANSGGGATGFSSLNRGVMPSRSDTPIVSTDRQGGDRSIMPSRGIAPRSGGVLETAARAVSTRPGISGRPTTAVGETGRSIATGGRLNRAGGILSDVPYSEPPAPTFTGNLFPFIGQPGGSPFLDPTNVKPGVTIQGFPMGGNIGTNPGVADPNSTPLDLNIDKLFRGFFNEPIRGSADKAGQFLYIPSQTSGGSNPGIIILVLAVLGIGGYFAYKKFAGG